MKKIFGIVLLCGFFACQSTTFDSNIELTEFTKELVSMYVNDEQNIDAINRNDEIIIVSFTDDTCYRLALFANNPQDYDYCREDYIGQTMYLGHAVKIFGDENTSFFRLIRRIMKREPCSYNNDWEYDPYVWYICLYKDGSLCTRETYKVAPEEDISEIQSLVEKYFSVLESNK